MDHSFPPHYFCDQNIDPHGTGFRPCLSIAELHGRHHSYIWIVELSGSLPVTSCYSLGSVSSAAWFTSLQPRQLRMVLRGYKFKHFVLGLYLPKWSFPDVEHFSIKALVFIARF